jgi:hypothetical protein
LRGAPPPSPRKPNTLFTKCEWWGGVESRENILPDPIVLPGAPVLPALLYCPPPVLPYSACTALPLSCLLPCPVFPLSCFPLPCFQHILDGPLSCRKSCPDSCLPAPLFYLLSCLDLLPMSCLLTSSCMLRLSYPHALIYCQACPPVLPLLLPIPVCSKCPASAASHPFLLKMSCLCCFPPLSAQNVLPLLPPTPVCSKCPASAASHPFLLKMSCLCCFPPLSAQNVLPLLLPTPVCSKCPASTASHPCLLKMFWLCCLPPLSAPHILPFYKKNRRDRKASCIFSNKIAFSIGQYP